MVRGGGQRLSSHRGRAKYHYYRVPSRHFAVSNRWPLSHGPIGLLESRRPLSALCGPSRNLAQTATGSHKLPVKSALDLSDSSTHCYSTTSSRRPPSSTEPDRRSGRNRSRRPDTIRRAGGICPTGDGSRARAFTLLSG